MRATEEITIAMIDLHAKQEQRLNDAVRLLRAVVDSTQGTNYSRASKSS
jgi:hypothetical protein